MTFKEVISAGWEILDGLPAENAVAELLGSDRRLSRASFQVIADVVSSELADQCGRCTGMVFADDDDDVDDVGGSSSLLLLYPALVGAVRAGAVPFCWTTTAGRAREPASWLSEAVEDLGIERVLCDGLGGLDRVRSDLDVKRVKRVWKGGEEELWAVNLKKEEEEDGEDGSPCLPACNLAYAVQTSGTTGRRKTVLVSSASFSSNLRDFLNAFRLGKSDRVFAASPPTFDPFYLDAFCAFVSGAALILAGRSLKRNSGRLLCLLKTSRPTFAQMTPTLYRNLRPGLERYLLEPGNPFRHVVLGGESFPRIAADLRESRTRFFVAYGVTEMSVWQTMYEVEKRSLDEEVPIFRGKDKNLISLTELKLLEDGEIVVTSKERVCFTSEQGFQVSEREGAKMLPKRIPG